MEYAIAYEEAYLRELYSDFALEVVEPVHYGLQDIVVAVKKRKKARVPALQWLKSLGPDKMAEEKAVDEIIAGLCHGFPHHGERYPERDLVQRR